MACLRAFFNISPFHSAPCLYLVYWVQTSWVRIPLLHLVNWVSTDSRILLPSFWSCRNGPLVRRAVFSACSSPPLIASKHVPWLQSVHCTTGLNLLFLLNSSLSLPDLLKRRPPPRSARNLIFLSDQTVSVCLSRDRFPPSFIHGCQILTGFDLRYTWFTLALTCSQVLPPLHSFSGFIIRSPLIIAPSAAGAISGSPSICVIRITCFVCLLPTVQSYRVINIT